MWAAVLALAGDQEKYRVSCTCRALFGQLFSKKSVRRGRCAKSATTKAPHNGAFLMSRVGLEPTTIGLKGQTVKIPALAAWNQDQKPLHTGLG